MTLQTPITSPISTLTTTTNNNNNSKIIDSINILKNLIEKLSQSKSPSEYYNTQFSSANDPNPDLSASDENYIYALAQNKVTLSYIDYKRLLQQKSNSYHTSTTTSNLDSKSQSLNRLVEIYNLLNINTKNISNLIPNYSDSSSSTIMISTPIINSTHTDSSLIDNATNSNSSHLLILMALFYSILIITSIISNKMQRNPNSPRQGIQSGN